MMKWWQDLQRRERAWVMAGLVLVFFSLYYVLIWDPLDAELRQQDERNANLLEQMAWMQNAAATVTSLRAERTVSTDAGSLLSLVDRAASGSQLRQQISQINQAGDNRVTVALEAVNFDNLVSMLGRLRKLGIRIEQLTLSRHDLPGQVSGRLVVVRE